MFEFLYIFLIVIQFAIGPMIMLCALPSIAMWLLFGVQIVAGIVQNVKFPCIQFRISSAALAALTLWLICQPYIF